MIALKPAKGHLLIAEPAIIGDASFTRSVVLIADYNESGTIGFILNKPLDYTLDELVPGINIACPIYNGGPVEQDNLYFIHSVPDLIPKSIEISNGIYWGGDFDTIIKLFQTGEITENDVRFFLGYSGWDQQQLDNELEYNSWVVVKNKAKSTIIKIYSDEFWKEQMLALGGDYLIWSNAPDNPSYN